MVAVHGHYFEQFYREAGLAPGSAIRLLTADGSALAAWPADTSDQLEANFAGIVDRLRQDPAGTTFIADEQVLAYRALPSIAAAVAVLAPLDPVLDGWRARTLRSGLVLAAAILGFGLLVAMGLRLAGQQRLALLELERAKENLETRVRDRTADLEQSEAELRLVANSVPALVSYVDSTERYRFVNAAYENWFGHGREALQGRTVREVVGAEAYEIATGNIARALAGERIAYQTVLPYREGARHVDAQYIPHIGPDGRTRGFYAFIVDVTERQRGEAAMRASEARYRALAEAIAAVIWTTGPDGRATDMPQWRALTGQTSAEVSGLGWLDAVHPDDRERTRQAWQRCVAAGTPCDVEYRVRRRDGHYRWFNGRGVAVRGEDGALREWIGVCIDISERKSAEERQTLLMAELDHRVRNILASIQSMVSLTGRSARTKHDYAEALQGRIAAMARTHDLLTRGRWSGANLEQIVRDELKPYDPGGHVVSLEGEIECILRPRQALNVALVVHELATNAAKYGALSVPDGRIAVSWDVQRLGDEARLRIVWQETGGPRVNPPRRRGFGSTMIENALRADPGSEARLEFAPAGVRCVITLRMDDVLPGRRIAPAAAALVDRALPPAPPNALRGERVLVVEDETLVAVELRLALCDAGAEVLGTRGLDRRGQAADRGEPSHGSDPRRQSRWREHRSAGRSADGGRRADARGHRLRRPESLAGAAAASARAAEADRSGDADRRRARADRPRRRTRHRCELTPEAAAPASRASSAHGLAAGELEVERARLLIDMPGLIVALLDPGDRQHLAVVAGREHLVGVQDVRLGQRRLLDLGAGLAQQPDHALAGDAVEEGAVAGRRHGDAVLGDPQVGGRELGDVGRGVERDRVVEAAPCRLDQSALHVGVEAARLGVGRRRVARRSAVAREAAAHALGLGHGRTVDREREVGRVRLRHDEAAAGEEHRPDVERYVTGEAAHRLAAEVVDLRGREGRLEQHLAGRIDQPCAVPVEVRCQPVEGAGAVEGQGCHPHGMVHRPEQLRLLVLVPPAVVPEDRRRHPPLRRPGPCLAAPRGARKTAPARLWPAGCRPISRVAGPQAGMLGDPGRPSPARSSSSPAHTAVGR